MSTFNNKWPLLCHESLTDLIKAKTLLKAGTKPKVTISMEKLIRKDMTLVSLSEFSFVTYDGQIFELFQFERVRKFKIQGVLNG